MAIILNILRRGHTISIQQVADAIGMSRQTLHRKLGHENAIFQTLADETRKGLCQELLTQSGASLAEISRQCGFQETSNLYKAFKRWFGMPPKAYLDPLAPWPNQD